MTGMVNQRDAISAGVVMLFAVAVFLTSHRLPTGPSDTPGSGVYPMFIAGCLFVLGIVQIVQSVVLKPSESDGPDISLSALKRLSPPFLALLAYILLLPVTGFLIGTVLFLVLLMRYSNITNYWESVPISIGVAVVLQYVFGSLLRVPLPDGLLPIVRLLPLLQLGVAI